MAITDPRKRQSYRRLALVFLVYSVLCFITYLVFDSSSGTVIKSILPPSGGEVGPIETKKDNSVFLIKVKQYIPTSGAWSFVGGDVLDAKKEYLFGFGKELWKERGYDSDGYWTEEDTSYNLKITLRRRGKYYLKFNVETGRASIGTGIRVEVHPKKGSALAFFILGIVSLLISVATWAIANVEGGAILESMSDDD
jgi:hypothetical protein